VSEGSDASREVFDGVGGAAGAVVAGQADFAQALLGDLEGGLEFRELDKSGSGGCGERCRN
jgi:hypothetical protein